MLKGQIHEESHNKTQEEKPNTNINVGIKKEKEENQKNNENEKTLEENSKNGIKIIKPRETYLKDKIKKCFSQSLISKINKSLDKQMQIIKLDLNENKLAINNTKDIKIYHVSSLID